jgi:hypothetical protein
MTALNYQTIVNEMQAALETPVAIADKYGIVLASGIPEFAPNTLIPPSVLRTLENKMRMIVDLGLKEINDLVLQIGDSMLVFTFGKENLFISKIPPHINLNQFLLGMDNFVRTLDVQAVAPFLPKFYSYDFEQEYNAMITELQFTVEKKRLDSFKSLVTHMVGKKKGSG